MKQVPGPEVFTSVFLSPANVPSHQANSNAFRLSWNEMEFTAGQTARPITITPRTKVLYYVLLQSAFPTRCGALALESWLSFSVDRQGLSIQALLVEYPVPISQLS
jgi:hypothetical protein